MDFLENYELNDEVLEEMNLDEIFPKLLETNKKLPATAKTVLAEMMDKYPIEEALAMFFAVDDDIDDTFADTFCYSNPDPYFKFKPLSVVKVTSKGLVSYSDTVRSPLRMLYATSRFSSFTTSCINWLDCRM